MSVTPAAALDDSGSVSCGTVATAAVRAEQQRIADTMYIYVGGYLRWSGANQYTHIYVSNLQGTRSWLGRFESLLLSGTYGFCQPREG